MTQNNTPAVRRMDDWSQERLRSLAQEYGTPLYVQDLQRMRENYQRLRAVFPEARIYFATKANTSHATISTLYDEGAGMECVSAGEIYRMLNAGVSAEDILYTAVNPPDVDLDYAVDINGITMTAGARDTIDRLAERGFAGRLCVRVNPGVGAGHHEHVSTGGNPKFGVPYDRVTETLSMAVDQGFEVVGIHAHVGSGILGSDVEAHTELVSRMSEVARKSPVTLEFIDIGGGFGVPYHPDEPPSDLEAVARSTRSALRGSDTGIAIEPGCYLVADAGVLLTQVNTVKETPESTVIGVDAGMNTLLRPALYDAYHHIRNISQSAGTRSDIPVTITGPICESADVFAHDRVIKKPARNDFLALGTTGAYGWEMSSQYNSRPRPAIVAIDGEHTMTVREPETFSDLINREVQYNDN